MGRWHASQLEIVYAGEAYSCHSDCIIIVNRFVLGTQTNKRCLTKHLSYLKNMLASNSLLWIHMNTRITGVIDFFCKSFGLKVILYIYIKKPANKMQNANSQA